ncbi:ABC transporter ATP-binding protein, partial [Patescibacteria group bacterium]|nr:ABC transporter ATP-binding protein [Patescibacteria group bacterium]
MPIIEVKNISKKYNITHQQGGYVALRDVLTNVFKNPFQFAKNKAKQAIGKAGKEEFWALKDINFSVEQGEIIGIIGPNGAGKSTLLKILTQITPPTTGEIKMRGRVASLLEVGTGFHPELTGRENIFLNGAIMGMTKKEINAKFNDIVEFSGIEKFLDTPVKRYSSGMHVRLAFSVAAHLEPDILLIDEVLAVGDADFQKKCLGKMEEVTKKDGRTILFV